MSHDGVTDQWAGSGASNSTSSGLLQRVKRHDPEAWQRLVKIYGPLIYRWCRQSSLQRDDSADIMQEVFRTVATRMAEFHHDRQGDTFRGWLAAITRNKIGDHLRRLQARVQAKGGTDAYEQMSEIAGIPDPAVGPSVEINPILQRALAPVRGEFEDHTWQAFWQVVVEGRSPADVADHLGMSRHAVYMAKSRVLCRLRQELEGQWF